MQRFQPATLASSLSVWLAAVVLAAARLPARAETGKTSLLADARTIDAWGKLGSERKGAETVRDLTIQLRDAKGKPVSEKILVEVPEGAEIFQDQPIRMEDLQVGDDVFILGRAVEREVPSKRGGGLGGATRRGTDCQIQAARAILAGKAIAVNESYADPRDAGVRWHRATVANSAAGLWVTYKSKEYRVTLEKAAPVLRRTPCDRKQLKSGRHAIVQGDRTKPPAELEASKAAPKPAFRVRRLVLLDPRYIATAYAAALR